MNKGTSQALTKRKGAAEAAIQMVLDGLTSQHSKRAYERQLREFINWFAKTGQGVPEQNAGTATVYAYNSDYTIHSITDARGVVTNFDYNARHLLTSITYPDAQSLPPEVSPAANVSIGYDAAGNRISMSDGLGSVSYSYDSLSRLQSETRQFSGPGAPSGSFTLSYEYNLATS